MGITHTSGRYHLRSDPFLKEGADQIENMGTQVIKLWFSADLQTSYPWNSDWSQFGNIKSLKELAQTTYYNDVFVRTQFKTIVLNSFEFNWNGTKAVTTNWKDGVSLAERDSIVKEFRELTIYLRNNPAFSGKTFILQNWEGDNALNFDAGTSVATQNASIAGMIQWLNARQDGITAGREATPTSTVTVAGCAEFNQIPGNGRTFAWKLGIDEVAPNLHMDMYSWSNWTATISGNEWKISDCLDYIRDKAPTSELFQRDNIMMGEFGSYELASTYLGNISNHTTESSRQQRESIGQQVELALKWGVKYIVLWELYCNGPRVDGVPAPGVLATEEQLKGIWLIRPDGSTTEAYDYWKALTNKYLSDYQSIYETENLKATVSTGDSEADLSDSFASAGKVSKLTADAVNDFIQYDVYVPKTGVYNIKIGVKKHPARGMFQLSVGGSNRGTPQDCYAATQTFQEIDIGDMTVTSLGNKAFRFKITGKNAASTNYDLVIDYIRLTYAKDNQTITFNVPAQKFLGDEPTPLNGVASSGLEVSYTSSNPSVVSFSGAGNLLKINGAGTAIISATQAGNNYFNAATPVIDTIEVQATSPTKTNQNIVFNPLQGKSVGDDDLLLTATATSGLTVSYTSSNPAVAEIVIKSLQPYLRVTGLGTATITAKQGGSNDFNPATDVSRQLLVSANSAGIISTSLIIDNVDAGFSRVGTWTSSTAGTGRYGANFFHDGSAGVDPSKSAKWQPNITNAGYYNVYMNWSADSNRPDAAPIEVAYSEGLNATNTVNQKVLGGTWILLGKYHFDAGNAGYVKIIASDEGYTVADAVKFELATLKVPTGLSAVPASGTSAALNWTAVAEATGYNVYRSSAETGTFVKLNTTPIALTSFLNNGLTTAETYYYRITALSSGGESNLSAAVFVIPEPTLSARTGTFSGTKSENGKVELKWRPFTMPDVSHFEVMHSSNGQQFNKLGQVPANSLNQDYRFVDYPSEQSTNYYQIHQVGVNGNHESFKVIAIDGAVKSLSMVAYQQQEQLHLEISAANTAVSEFSIFDVGGQQLHKSNLNTTKGHSRHRVRVNLSTGIYILVLKQGSELVRIKCLFNQFR